MKNISVPVKAIKINPGFNPKACSLDTLDSIQSIFTEFQQEIELVCINCQKWLRNQTKIITQSDFYCVGCFAALLPTCQYYQVIRHDSFDIFGGGWPVKHQLLMLTAFQRFGFGNLKAVQEYMGYLGANYFMDQIQYHYNKFYRNQVQKLQENCSIVDLRKISNPSRKHRSRNCRGGKSIQKSTWASMYRMYHQNEQEIPCYNSKRQQFSIEYNQNLEKYICDLEFRENDSQKEMEIKFQILEAYNAGLEDRIEKHNFIIEHKLLDQNYQAQEARYLELNSYAYKANQILIQLMRTMTRDEYVQLRKQLEFCLRIQALIESIRSVKASNSACSLKSLSRLDRKKQKQDEELGKPRKRVHRNPEDEEQEQEKAILKKLNVSKEELRVMINRAHQQSQTVIFKGLKITPIKN